MDKTDMERVVFTKHALEQFEKRFRIVQRGQFPKDPMDTLYKLLRYAEEDHSMSDVKRVNRLIRHECKPTRYLLRHGWRFVIVEEEGTLVVITIEHKSLKF